MSAPNIAHGMRERGGHYPHRRQAPCLELPQPVTPHRMSLMDIAERAHFTRHSAPRAEAFEGGCVG
eukprot:3556204-Rhodomonas_salina.4